MLSSGSQLGTQGRPAKRGTGLRPKGSAPGNVRSSHTVPLIVLCNVGRGQDEKTFTPGPAMSILPPFEKTATRSELSSAPQHDAG